jgi:hypothetical protein
MRIKQGKTWQQPVQWLDENDDPIDLTDCVFRAQLRADYADAEVEAGTEPLLNLTMGDGITIDAGDIILRAEAETTVNIPAGSYLLELEVTRANGDEEQLFLERVAVEPEVVR